MSNKATTRSFFQAAAIWLLMVLCAGPVSAQDAGRRARMQAVQSLEAMIMGPESGIEPFIEQRLSQRLRASSTPDSLRQLMKALRTAASGAGGVDLSRDNDDILLVFSAGADAIVVMRMDESEPEKIGYLGLKAPRSAGEMTAAERLQEARRRTVRALETLGTTRGDTALEAFAEEHMSSSARRSLGDAKLLEMLGEIRRISAAAGAISVTLEDDGTHLTFRGPESIRIVFTLEEVAPHRIGTLRTRTDLEPVESVEIAPITWENLEERLLEEEEAGFAGTILIARNGEIVLHRGYGAADQDLARPNTTETIFGIGSVPIDFTRMAIAKLEEAGQLRRGDPISRFFDGVPADKASMTIEHLMTGRSGLPNFHHIPGVDEDYDLTWIDREEALRRMLSQPLLFTPGEGQSHSHSAYVLLAAVVEEVSGSAYSEYLQSAFFDPIGMAHTGFYGNASGFSAEQMAVGYGGSRVGEINIPLNWGPTSWLMMGSGGMVSTPGDLYTWLQAIHSGRVLSIESVRSWRRGGIAAGSSDRGFLTMYIDDAENTVIICSNVHVDDGDLPMTIARALVGLASGR